MIIDIQDRHEKRTKKILLIKCDQCFNLLEKPYAIRLVRREYHFCNKQCQSKASEKGNILDQKRKNACLKKYGAESHTNRSYKYTTKDAQQIARKNNGVCLSKK